jgi:SH3-like domain-containing protein
MLREQGAREKMRCYLRRLSIMAALFVVFSAHDATAERLSVSTQIANIRSGPATTYDVLWQVQKYYPILVLKKSGPWVNFKDFEGDEGWIHQSLLQQIPTVITIKEKCNVRSGPGTQYRILFTVGRGIPFHLIKREGGWIQIEHADGDRGWIYQTLVW